MSGAGYRAGSAFRRIEHVRALDGPGSRIRAQGLANGRPGLRCSPHPGGMPIAETDLFLRASLHGMVVSHTICCEMSQKPLPRRWLDELLLQAGGRNSLPWLELLIAMGGATIAFLMGYFHAAATPMEGNWAQAYMGAAANYACSGSFAAIRLAPDATPADVAGLAYVNAFLSVSVPDFSCSLFPQHVVPTSFLDGIGAANTEQPTYIILLYGVLWRLFGLHWSVTLGVVGGIAAISFLVVYLCARRFMSPLIACGTIILFFASPLYLPHILSPRDGLKFPFAVAVSALLITAVASPKSPGRFLLAAACTGATIGVGYGFRPDLLLFLLPALVILCFVSEPAVVARSGSSPLLARLGARVASVVALLLCFAVAGALPLLNDYFVYPSYADTGFHPMAMGLLGIHDAELFQGTAGDGSMYMFRNNYHNDLAIGVRVMEYAARKFAEDIDFAAGSYWTFAKHYYLDVVRYIPADVLSGVIGAIVNIMTLPHLPPTFLTQLAQFAANSLVAVAFLARITRAFGFRSAIAATIVFGAILAVASLKFDMRHMFYAYVFIVLAWGSALSLLLHAVILRSDPDVSAGDTARKPVLAFWQAAGMAAALLVVISVAMLAALWGARIYQADILRGLIADIVARPRVATDYRVSEGSAGRRLVQPLSPMPLSTGGRRDIAAPATDRPEMGVVVIRFDGKRCAGRAIEVTSGSQPRSSHPGVDSASLETAFAIRERFEVRLGRGSDFLAFLPAFFVSLSDKGGSKLLLQYAGVELKPDDVLCIKAVSYLDEFRKTDVLFDFFVPEQPAALTRDDLFKRLYVPGA